MNRNDLYRKHAAEAMSFADRATRDEEKAAWLEIAKSWLMMIRKSDQDESDKVDHSEAKRGTHQSEGEQ